MLNIASLILGAALLAPAAALLAALLARGASRAEFVVAALLCAFAIVVGESILLSLVHALTRPALLAAQAIALAAVLLAWHRAGRPRPPSFRTPPRHAIVRAARAHPVVALLIALTVLTLAFQAFIAISVAPNEYDTLGYHLPRAAFWLQHHSALQYNPGASDDPEQVQPPNAEIVIAWTMSLTRSDSFAQLVQWFALIGVLAALFAGTRVLGFTRSAAAFVAALFALLPLVQLQSSTGQNDIVLTFVLVGGLLFAVQGIRLRSLGRLALAAIAAGLAVGTKYDAALALPAVLLIVGAQLRRSRPPAALVLRAGALLLAATLVLGSFNYVQNLVNDHSLTGFSGALPGDWVKTNPLADTVHNAWDMLDAEWLPQPSFIANSLQHLANHVFSDVHGADFQNPPQPAINNGVDPASSAYGLIGWLLLVPAILLAIFRRRTPPALRILALASASYFLALTIVIGYADETPRFLMPAVALAMPLLAPLERRTWTAALAAVLVIATLPGTLVKDDYKPLPSVFSLDRIDQQTLDNDLTSLGPGLHRLAALVPKHAALGFLQQDNFPEYLLFGEPLQRRLVGLDPPQITARTLHAQHLTALFIGFADQPPCSGRLCLAPTPGLRITRIGSDSLLVTP